jgi:hypothetical protein
MAFEKADRRAGRADRGGCRQPRDAGADDGNVDLSAVRG